MRKRLRKHAHQARPFNAFHLIKITKLNCNFNQKMKREKKKIKWQPKWILFNIEIDELNLPFSIKIDLREKKREILLVNSIQFTALLYFFSNNQTKLSIDCKSTWKIPIFTFLSCSFHVATLTQNRSHIITNTSHEYK